MPRPNARSRGFSRPPRPPRPLLASAASLGLVSSIALASSIALGAPTTPLPAPGAAPSPDAEQLRKGVVQVEQGGRPLAIGTVLSKDGRVLTSLSALGAVEQPELRYADNTVVKAKIGHKDKGWDLALLIPQSGRWLDGLMPTDIDPNSGELKTFLPKSGKLAATGIGFKGRTNARSKEGDALASALDVDLKGSPSIPGAPILEPGGRVVGVLVRACKEGDKVEPEKAAKDTKDKDKPSCTPILVGAPVYALRSFVMKTPTAAAMPAPWLGLGGAPTESGNVKGVRVMGVAPGSPAEKAGLKASTDSPDTIVAVDGAPVETPEQLAEAIAKHAIGQSVKLLVFSQGKFREAAVTLRAAP